MADDKKKPKLKFEPVGSVTIGDVQDISVYEVSDAAELVDLINEVAPTEAGGECGQVEFYAPPRDRVDGVVAVVPEKTVEWFDNLKTADHDTLRALGMCLWADDEDPELWLFPASWYDYIPEGYVCGSILEDMRGPKVFKYGAEGDDDSRFGMLSFGIRRPATEGRPFKSTN